MATPPINPKGNPILRVCAGLIGLAVVALFGYEASQGTFSHWWTLLPGSATLAYALFGNRPFAKFN